MNGTTSNIFQKIADHIDYYYWNPQPGHPPRWLNIMVFSTSLFLWFVAWAPIKVKTTEVLQLSSDKGDEVYLIENTGEKSSYRGSISSDWMKLKINKKDYWCICKMNFCPHSDTKANRARGFTIKDPLIRGDLKVIIINNKYCLVIEKYLAEGKGGNNINFSLSSSEIKHELRNVGPMENYNFQKYIWGWVVFIYLIGFIYKAKFK
ncbi:hypothetical protein [uncultured Cardiobacterium sp.]|uniref:hypothetical protein n=1 Tax=uncultured Cardiobacterium sp. TaxID=417619 RepID=UPI00260DD5EE|nr:hypothetical protein [uncultured Cardiobacterium sp.]